MRSVMKAEWIKSQTSEMDGLWRRGVFQKVLRSFLTQTRPCFHKLFQLQDKAKRGEIRKV